MVPYNNYNDLVHYYSEMSAMGDVPRGADSISGRIQDISIPLCLLHALDDPLLPWTTVAQNNGYMHPTNTTSSGSGNLMLLLTKRGGHVGWPTGLNPAIESWRWMNEAALSFGAAVHKVTAASME